MGGGTSAPDTSTGMSSYACTQSAAARQVQLPTQPQPGPNAVRASAAQGRSEPAQTQEDSLTRHEVSRGGEVGGWLQRRDGRRAEAHIKVDAGVLALEDGGVRFVRQQRGAVLQSRGSSYLMLAAPACVPSVT